jgi:hypothetical protein
MNQEELLENLYNAFDPFEPLPGRCVLEYRWNGERWHDVHPLIRDTPEFKQEVAKMKE